MKNKLQSEISRTLYIPLAARANEAKKSNPVLLDEKAVEILKSEEMNGTYSDGGELVAFGLIARTTVIDNELKKLLSVNPDLAVINLGAGLDTRFIRIDNGQLQWWDVDLPDVVALRRKYFTESDRVKFIVRSVLDKTWLELMEKNGRQVVIIAEGLLMYFSEEETQNILIGLADNFPGAHMFFDIVHPLFTVEGVDNLMSWKPEDVDEIKKIDSRIQVLNSWYIGGLLEERQTHALRQMFINEINRKADQIIHIKFND